MLYHNKDLLGNFTYLKYSVGAVKYDHISLNYLPNQIFSERFVKSSRQARTC